MAAAPRSSAAPKPRIRVRVGDSYENFAARLGIGTENYATQSTYGFNPITRVRTLLEWMYRGSWLVGKAVDCIPQDMCKRGIKFLGIQDLKKIETLKQGMRRYGLWQHVMMTLTWSRLYGGAICVMMIKGQDVSTPLRVETVGKGQLQGFLVLDRWMIEPSLEDLVTDMDDADLGKPRFYTITADAPALPRLRVHHSRVMRFVGVELPYWQMIAENMWGMSVLERLYDRLVAFDSATQGASQLMYRADIRTYSVEGLRKIIAAGGPAYDALVSQIKHNALWQANERMFVIDSTDKFERQQYAFTGISDTILQFGQQISGAMDIPLTRLFGQSPAGMNATGESDLITYYDGIQQRQETDLRPRLGKPLRVIARSEGVDDEGVSDFTFNPLWQLTEEEKSTVAEKITALAIAAVESGIISEKTALKELRSQSSLTGVWTQITDEDIDSADDRRPPSQAEVAEKMEEQMQSLPEPEGDMPKEPAEGGKPPPGSPPVAKNDPLHLSIIRGAGDTAIVRREFQGIPIAIETPKNGWRNGFGLTSTKMPGDYGYIMNTGSTEGAYEGIDVLVGPEAGAPDVWVADMYRPDGKFDEHKVLLGWSSETIARKALRDCYKDRNWREPLTHMTVENFKTWLSSGDLMSPIAGRPGSHLPGQGSASQGAVGEVLVGGTRDPQVAPRKKLFSPRRVN